MVLGSASKKQTLIYQDIYEEIWTKLKATPSYQQTQEESILFFLWDSKDHEYEKTS